MLENMLNAQIISKQNHHGIRLAFSELDSFNHQSARRAFSCFFSITVFEKLILALLR